MSAFLVERIFPRQARVLTVAELGEALAEAAPAGPPARPRCGGPH